MNQKETYDYLCKLLPEYPNGPPTSYCGNTIICSLPGMEILIGEDKTGDDSVLATIPDLLYRIQNIRTCERLKYAVEFSRKYGERVKQ